MEAGGKRTSLYAKPFYLGCCGLGAFRGSQPYRVGILVFLVVEGEIVDGSLLLQRLVCVCVCVCEVRR